MTDVGRQLREIGDAFNNERPSCGCSNISRRLRLVGDQLNSNVLHAWNGIVIAVVATAAELIL